MNKKIFYSLLAFNSCAVSAAPMDAFTSISSFQPDQNLTLTGSVDYFKAKSKAKNDNQRDYQGFTLGSHYVISPEWYTDIYYWDRTIKYGSNDNDIQSWKLGLNYVPELNLPHDDTLSFGLSFWGNYADEFNKSSRTKYQQYTLSETSLKKPKDFQLQVDAIYSKKLNKQNTINVFANAAYSKVQTDAISGVFNNKNCNFDIHIDKNNHLHGQLQSPCTINNTLVNDMTISADANQYGIDIQKQLNYESGIFGLGLNWQWQYENFKTLLGYNFQYFARDIPDNGFYEQKEQKTNHIFALEMSYSFHPEWEIFLQNQFFTHSFVGTIPSLYNPITASAMDKSYDYVSLGIRFTPF